MNDEAKKTPAADAEPDERKRPPAGHEDEQQARNAASDAAAKEPFRVRTLHAENDESGAH